MNWHTGAPPREQGEYLVIDRVYRNLAVAHWRNDLGWEIRGRWLGKDAVECWMDTRDLPKPPERK